MKSSGFACQSEKPGAFGSGIRNYGAKAAFLALVALLPLLLFGTVSQELEGADSLNVGTPFTFKITADYAIKAISIPDSLDDFAIIASKQSPQKTNGWQLKIVPLKTGALSFPRLQVQPADNVRQPEYTDGFRVYVLSVLSEGDSLLRDIKPFQPYPWQPPFWAYVLLFVAALGLGLFLLLTRKRKLIPVQVSAPQTGQTALPAWQKAINELEALEKQELNTADYHFAISQILRTFLEATYRFPALEMTNSEIKAIFRKRLLDPKGEIISFLAYCDQVKFAKVIPDSAEIAQRVQWLKNYFTSFSSQVSEVADA